MSKMGTKCARKLHYLLIEMFNCIHPRLTVKSGKCKLSATIITLSTVIVNIYQ